MQNERLAMARAALRQVEKSWRMAETIPTDRTSASRFLFQGIDLKRHISSGGILPFGLHEIICYHDDSAATTLALYFFEKAVLPQGSGPTDLQMQNSAPNKQPVFWVCQEGALDQGTFYPLGLPMSDQNHFVMVQLKRQPTALWATEEIANSGQAKAIILETREYDLTAARRLQLACEQNKTCLIVLRHQSKHQPIQPSAALTRWQITPCANNTEARQHRMDHSAQGLPYIFSPIAGLSRIRNYHSLSLIGGRGVRPASWKITINAEPFSISVADTLENRLSPDHLAAERENHARHIPPHNTHGTPLPDTTCRKFT